MQLLIMRHGDAIGQAKTDAERPLSEYGKSQAQSMVQYLVDEPPTRLIASPYLRAQQTAKIIQKGLLDQGVSLDLETAGFITPNDAPAKVIKALAEMLEDGQTERLMMVSHQPLVGSLLTLLTEGSTMGYPVSTASVACLDCEFLDIGQATLNWMKTP